MPQTRLLSYSTGIFCPSANPGREMHACAQLDQPKQIYPRSRALKAQKSLSPQGHWSFINDLSEDLEACSVTSDSLTNFQPCPRRVLKTFRGKLSFRSNFLPPTEAVQVTAALKPFLKIKSWSVKSFWLIFQNSFADPGRLYSPSPHL